LVALEHSEGVVVVSGEVAEVDVGETGEQVLALEVQKGLGEELVPVKLLCGFVVEDVEEGGEDVLEDGVLLIGQFCEFEGLDLGDAFLETGGDGVEDLVLGLDLFALDVEVAGWGKEYPAPPSMNLLSLFFFILRSLTILLYCSHSPRSSS
jgi:hypothetical protein